MRSWPGYSGSFPTRRGAAWAYTRALLTFREQGDTIKARQALKLARKTNKYIPAYLAGEKMAPVDAPAYFTFGDESEAWNYVDGFLVGWKSTPGAISWVRANSGKKKAKDAPPARGPEAAVKKSLTKNLRQEQDVWQADFQQLPNWIRVGGQPIRPWVILVVSRTHGGVLAHEMPEVAPTFELLWDILAQAMQHPAVGERHRPIELQVRQHEFWSELQPHLDEVGVKLEPGPNLDLFDEVFAEMAVHICGAPQPGFLDIPGITLEQAASFFAAAAWFFQQSPWKKVGCEAIIKIECGKYQSGPWYAALMGQLGLTTGMTLQKDLGTLKAMFIDNSSDEENARRAVGSSVTFGEEWEIPFANLEAAKKYGWQVARPDAYPDAFCIDGGAALRPALAWELELLEACLRAVPAFITHHKQDDPAKQHMEVPVASGVVAMALSWVLEE